jgi:hypothetical protein
MVYATDRIWGVIEHGLSSQLIDCKQGHSIGNQFIHIYSGLHTMSNQTQMVVEPTCPKRIPKMEADGQWIGSRMSNEHVTGIPDILMGTQLGFRSRCYLQPIEMDDNMDLQITLLSPRSCYTQWPGPPTAGAIVWTPQRCRMKATGNSFLGSLPSDVRQICGKSWYPTF